MESKQNVVVATQKKRSFAPAGALVLAFLGSTSTYAAPAAPAAPDVTAIVTYIGLLIGAVVAIGSAKLMPSAAMWMYSSLTGMVKRG